MILGSWLRLDQNTSVILVFFLGGGLTESRMSVVHQGPENKVRSAVSRDGLHAGLSIEVLWRWFWFWGRPQLHGYLAYRSSSSNLFNREPNCEESSLTSFPLPLLNWGTYLHIYSWNIFVEQAQTNHDFVVLCLNLDLFGPVGPLQDREG